MFKNLMLVGIGLAGTLVTSAALADTSPGSPTVASDGGGPATLTIPSNREITTQFLPAALAPVNDGYVLFTEAVGGCISDIAIFWNGTTLPGATPGTADRVLVISDDPKNDDGGAGNSCLSDFDIGRVLGHPQYAPAFAAAGISTLAQLQTLINSRTGAGLPITVLETSTSLPDGGTVDNTSLTATNDSNDASVLSQTYAFADPPNGAEQIPALPPWAMFLFGGALLLPGLYFVNRSRLARGSATG